MRIHVYRSSLVKYIYIYGTFNLVVVVISYATVILSTFTQKRRQTMYKLRQTRVSNVHSTAV